MNDWESAQPLRRRGDRMRRREFITLIAGSAFASPVIAHAQQKTIPVIGFLSSASPNAYAGRVTAFRKGLNESGYIDGKDVAIEFRWAKGQYDQLPVFAADLVRQKVAVILSSGGDIAALSAKAATSSIPIVTVSGTDPVQAGLVASFNRPRRQHHRRKLCRNRVGNKAAGNFARSGSYSCVDWGSHQPEQSGC
jgi:ABC-type uncharacterized transport system substrate-binding protein